MDKMRSNFSKMTLRWFGDPEDPNYQFTEDEGEDFELVFGEEEEPEGPDPDELQSELEQTKAQLEEQKKRMEEIEAIREGFEQVGGKVEDLQRSQQPTQPQQPQFDYEKFKQEIDDGFMESPSSALDKYFQMKMQPEVQRLMSNNMANSRRFLGVDDQRKDTYKQWQSEIEAEVQQMPPQSKLYDPDVYQKAHDRVMSRHLNEIVDMRVKQALEQQEKKGGEEGSGGPYSETSERRPTTPQKKTKKIVPTQEERTLMEKWRLRGIPEEQFPGLIARRRNK
jgi:hypothetical protein